MANEPMSDERLAEIRARVEAATKGYWIAGTLGGDLMYRGVLGPARIARIDATDGHKGVADLLYNAYNDLSALLADNERLRAREAALVAVAQRVMDATEDWEREANHSWLYFDDAHAASDLQEQARALLASAGEQAAQMESAPHCDYCSQPWAVQAWRVNMEVREWLCAAHFDDLSSDRLYRVERDRRSEQEEVLYSDEEAEAAYHSYEDDVAQGEAQGEGTSDDE